MRLSEDGGVELTPAERDEFLEQRPHECAFIVHLLATGPTDHDRTVVIPRHIRSCRTCAHRAVTYYRDQATGGDA
jgi:hypothetical protein